MARLPCHDGKWRAVYGADADSEQVPDTFSISWKFDNFMMTFTNGEVFRGDEIENWGVFFVGSRGSLQVNRQGWAVRPVVPHVVNKVAATSAHGWRCDSGTRYGDCTRSGGGRGAGGVTLRPRSKRRCTSIRAVAWRRLSAPCAYA